MALSWIAKIGGISVKEVEMARGNLCELLQPLRPALHCSLAEFLKTDVALSQ